MAGTFIDAPVAPGPRQAFVFTALAAYQTRFWIAVARRLRSLGYPAAIIAFDDRSAEMASREEDLPVFNAADGLRACPAAVAPSDLADHFARFGIAEVNALLAHERAYFGLGDSRAMARRLFAYLEAVRDGLDRLIARGQKPVLVQETGGFLSVLAAFHAARWHGLDNWFIEPSFFRGRVFLVANSLAAPAVPGGGTGRLSSEVAAYLDRTLAEQAIVIPEKDRHQYRSAAHKLVNMRNLVRLTQKLADKHLLDKHQEFGHIGWHVRQHVKYLVTSLRLSRHYRPLSDLRSRGFVYYPLHVPADMALTIRSPEYLDQLALVDYLARSVPYGCSLAIKEHPAQIGSIDLGRLRALLKRHDNLVILPPTTPNYQVLAAAAAVVSVNSKSGAEALLVGTPVIVLGDAFYRTSGLVTAVDGLAELPRTLAEAVSAPRHPDPDAVRLYFQSVWDHSWPGELYSCDPANVERLVDSLLGAIAPAQPMPSSAKASGA